MALNVKILEGNPEKGDIIVSPFGDFKISSNSLYTEGIGPCLSIALYDPIRKIGGLAHISGFHPREALSPEYIIHSMVAEFGVYQKLEAVLAGESLRKDRISNIVKRNLALLTIPVIGEDLGDSGFHQGRALRLDCPMEEVTVYRLPSKIYK